MEKTEIRSYSEERAMPTVLRDTEGKDTRTIEGYAVVFDIESRVMFDMQRKRCFVEVIRRGAVTEADLKTWDIKALMEHDKHRLLARSRNGVGTLQLSIDDYGVKYRFDSPNTTEGDNALEMIRRRDIFGSSFAYTADEKAGVSYTKRNDGLLFREVKRFNRMFDVAPVSDPAYFGTNVNVRSLDEYFEEDPPQDESYKEEVEKLRSLTK